MLKEFTETSNALIVKLCGEIDQFAVAKLKTKIDIEIEMSGKKNLIIDLSDVTLMDSSGIALIIGRYKLLSAIGGKMALCGASATVKRMLEIGGIGRIISHYKNKSEAYNSFSVEINDERSE